MSSPFGGYADLSFLGGDTMAEDQTAQTTAGVGVPNAAGENVKRLAVLIVFASLITLWFLGYTFK